MRRPARGMTLIEVMVAFGILVTGLVSIFAMLHAGLRSHKRAMNETEASAVGATVMADLRADFQKGTLPKSDGFGTFVPSTDFDGYSFRRQIVPLEPKTASVGGLGGDREYFVRVEVRWSDQGDNKSVSFDTVMFYNRENKLQR